LTTYREGRICSGTDSPRSGCPGMASVASDSSAGRPTTACWPPADRAAVVGTPVSDTRPLVAGSGSCQTTRRPPSGTTWVTRRVA